MTKMYKRSILFVCLGNICRSPAADGIMHYYVDRAGLGDTITIDSAGTYGGHAGELPDGRMREAAARRGFSLTHRSRQFRCADFDRFDMIITMDDSNYHDVYRLATTTEQGAKIFRMTEFQSRHTAHYVPDPYYEGAEGFELVLDLLEDCCEGLLNHLQREAAAE